MILKIKIFFFNRPLNSLYEFSSPFYRAWNIKVR